MIDQILYETPCVGGGIAVKMCDCLMWMPHVKLTRCGRDHDTVMVDSRMNFAFLTWRTESHNFVPVLPRGSIGRFGSKLGRPVANR